MTRDTGVPSDGIVPIAIVGMATRFSGNVSSTEDFWDMLVHQRSGHGPVPPSRYDAGAWTHPSHSRKGAIRPSTGFFLDQDISLFDAPFFSITTKEAMGMDPMLRQALEVSYECFENAGVPMSALAGSKTSVYAGVMTNDYERLSQSDVFDLPENAATGTSRAMLSNRLSWFFDLAGPSLTLDTACSSSLYALHLACQSIRLGESDQSLITGVNLILDTNYTSQLSSMQMLSPDGMSHSFDERANGYARGEAIGAILVKPLSAALRDGDTIRAVIRASGTNQDGRTPGITMPSADAQTNLIRSTYAAAGLSLADTSYFEAHGTGTKIGDPIELSAIAAAFASERASDDPLYVSSVKPNVGHTEGMAGLAGVIKTTLSLEHAVLPGLTEFQTLNPKLRLKEWKLALPVGTIPWPSNGLRRASVNSFGFGGANAHVIIDDAYHYLSSRGLTGNHRSLPSHSSALANLTVDRAIQDKAASAAFKLLPLSMHDQEGLGRSSKALASFFAHPPAGVTLDDLAYTLAARRTHFNIRSYAVSNSISALASGALDNVVINRQQRRGQPENIIFVFTGQSAQWPLMGRELLGYDVFRASVERSQQHLNDLGCAWNIIDVLCDSGPRINETEFCQPICTILQIALLHLLAHWKVTPAAVVGHSSGEMAAAAAAGAISQKDAVKIAYFRGYYCSQIATRLEKVGKKGSMLAAGITAEEAEQYIQGVAPDSVVIGCFNSPSSVTLSGDEASIIDLEERIKGDNKFARKLKVDVAYHSHHMRLISEDFLQAMGTIECSEKFTTPMFSSVTTTVLDSPRRLDAAYWVTNMVSPVRFSEAVANLLSHKVAKGQSRRKVAVRWSAAVEIGPHEALKGPFRQCVAKSGPSNDMPYTSLIRRGVPGDRTALEAAGLLWSFGHPLDLLRVSDMDSSSTQSGLKTLTCLPPYAWNHNKGLWHEPAASTSKRLTNRPRNDFLGAAAPRQNAHEMKWNNQLRMSEMPWVADHAITGTVLYPAAGMLIMAFMAALEAAATQGKEVSGVEFHDVHFERGLVIPSDEAVQTSLSLRPHETLDSWFVWTVFSRAPAGDWAKNSFGMLSLVNQDNTAAEARSKHELERLEAVRSKAHTQVDPARFYEQLAAIGMGYGPTFTNLVEAAAVEGEHLGYGRIQIPDTRSTMPAGFEYDHILHPATLDALFHLIFVALSEGRPIAESAIPLTIESLYIGTSQPTGAGATFVGYGSAETLNERDASGSLTFFGQGQSNASIRVTNMIVRKVSSTSTSAETRPDLVPKRVAELIWKEDVDLLDTDAAVKAISREALRFTSLDLPLPLANAAAWIVLACHKRSDLHLTVLVDDVNQIEQVIRLLTKIGPAPGAEGRLSNVSIIATSEDAEECLHTRSLQGQEAVDHTEQPVDLILVVSEAGISLVPQKLDNIVSKMAPGGQLVLSHDTPEIQVEGLMAARGLTRTITRASDSTGSFAVFALPAPERDDLPDLIYVIQPSRQNASFHSFRSHLVAKFASSTTQLVWTSLQDMTRVTGQSVIALLELEDPFVSQWSRDEYEQFRTLMLSQSYVLWVSQGGLIEAGQRSLDFAPTTGLLRTMRSELPQICVPHLDFSSTQDIEQPSAAQLIRQVFEATINGGPSNETEFIEQDGSLLIPRAVASEELDSELNAVSSRPTPTLATLADFQDCPLALRQLDLQWDHDVEAATPLQDDECMIRTECTALDAVSRSRVQQGTTSFVPSRIVSGVITHVGAGVSRFAPGDMVYYPVLEGTGYQTHARQKSSLVRKVPLGVEPVNIAQLCLSMMSAVYALQDIGWLLDGESVLIHLQDHHATLAAICAVEELGGRAFVVTSSEHSKAAILEHSSITPQRVFLASESAALPGGGCDVVLSDHSGVARRKICAHVVNSGRFIDMSGHVKISDLDAGMFLKNISFSSTDLWQAKQSTIARVFEKTSALLTQMTDLSTIRAEPSYSISDISIAMRAPQEKATSATITFHGESAIPVVPTKPAALSLNAEATYLIAGGLGALGLTIAENMVVHGARHLVLLSRSGITTDRQTAGVDKLRLLGCKVDTPNCDVTNKTQVAGIREMAHANSWKIRGLVQCAMVLEDGIFESMEYEQWLRATQPKILGTRNLHRYLPQDMDFFIILSSMSGIIGNPGQANYAAGNSYEDAFARFRKASGLVATTLNVGLVTDASHFTPQSTIEDYLKRYGHWSSATVSDREMQTVIEAVMRAAMAGNRNALPTQLLVGVSGEIPRNRLNPWSKDPKFNHRISGDDGSRGSGSAQGPTLAESIQLAESRHDVAALVEVALQTYLAAAMAASPGDIDVTKPLYSFGVDSLKAMEVRNWAFKELKSEVSVFDLLSPMPLVQLAAKIAAKSGLVRAEVASRKEED